MINIQVTKDGLCSDGCDLCYDGESKDWCVLGWDEPATDLGTSYVFCKPGPNCPGEGTYKLTKEEQPMQKMSMGFSSKDSLQSFITSHEEKGSHVYWQETGCCDSREFYVYIVISNEPLSQEEQETLFDDDEDFL